MKYWSYLSFMVASLKGNRSTLGAPPAKEIIEGGDWARIAAGKVWNVGINIIVSKLWHSIENEIQWTYSEPWWVKASELHSQGSGILCNSLPFFTTATWEEVGNKFNALKILFTWITILEKKIVFDIHRKLQRRVIRSVLNEFNKDSPK